MKKFPFLFLILLMFTVLVAVRIERVESATSSVTGYKLPWTTGQTYMVTGVRTGHNPVDGVPRQAIDFGVPLNQPIRAMRAGDIVYSRDIGGITNGYVVIDHNNGYCSAYVHLSQLEYGTITSGRRSVKQGEVIGESGRSYTNGAIHLHVAVYQRSNNNCGQYGNNDKKNEVVIIFDEVGRELNYRDYVRSANQVQQSNSDYIFTDVRPGDPSFWAVEEIEAIYHAGITRGCDSNGVPYQTLPFCPEQEMKRQELAIFLLKMKYGANYQPSSSYKGIFSDVDNHPWRLWFEKLYEDGITNGCNSDGIPYQTLRFCPEDTVIRAHLAVMFARSEGWNTSPTTGIFEDVTGDRDLDRAIEYMWWKGYTAGCGGNSGLRFCPNDIVQRAHFAVFAARIDGLVSAKPRCATLETTVQPASSGQISLSGSPDCPIDSSQYQYDTLNDLTAIVLARSNFEFSHWSGDLSGDSAENSIATGHETKRITANFTEAAAPSLSNLTVRTTDKSGNPKIAFSTSEAVGLSISARNNGSANADTLWDWDVLDPSGNTITDMSYFNFAVAMASGDNGFGYNADLPENAPRGDYTFVGRIKDTDGNTLIEDSTTFNVSIPTAVQLQQQSSRTTPLPFVLLLVLIVLSGLLIWQQVRESHND